MRLEQHGRVVASAAALLCLGCLGDPTVFKCDPATGQDCDAGKPGDAGFPVGSITTFSAMPDTARLVLADLDGDGHADLALGLTDGGLELWTSGVGRTLRRTAALEGAAPSPRLAALPRTGTLRWDLVLWMPGSRVMEIRRGADDADGGRALEVLQTISLASPPLAYRFLELTDTPPQDLLTLEAADGGYAVNIYRAAGDGSPYQLATSFPAAGKSMTAFSNQGRYVVTFGPTRVGVAKVSPNLVVTDAGVVTTAPQSELVPAFFQPTAQSPVEAWLLGTLVDGGTVTALSPALSPAPVSDVQSHGLVWQPNSGLFSTPFTWTTKDPFTTVVALTHGDAGVYAFAPQSAAGGIFSGDYVQVVRCDPVALASADINGDGKPDLAIAASPGRLILVMSK
jgi:FG-GAP repeat